MNVLNSVRRTKLRALKSGGSLCLPVLALVSCTVLHREQLSVIPKWDRFELTFTSSVAYSNALQQATLTAVFVSSLGATNNVYGFWDGGVTWRVRFSPDQAGRWTYQTTCSDPENEGLQNKSGAFLCTAPVGTNRFQRHGPVRVARDHRHFEHADRTPFFWLADTTLEGARLSTPKEWEQYAAVRSAQQFSAVQWAVAPGEDARQQSAFAGTDRIAVNPEFFRRLDARVDTLNHAGLLSVIIPLWKNNPRDMVAIPGDQLALLLRYMAARWDANDIAWLLMFDGEQAPESAAVWQTAGREVFGNALHAPVILFSGPAASQLDAFRAERWVDAFGYGTGQIADDAALKWLVSGPAASEWAKEPARPFLNVAPPFENGTSVRDGKSIGADLVRRIAWLNLLQAPPAGVSYGAQDTVYWNPAMDQQTAGTGGRGMPAWQEALFLPGAKQMSTLATLMNSLEYWRLIPGPQSLAVRPEAAEFRRFIATAFSKEGDLGLAYVPEQRSIELPIDALPPSPVVDWINPRTGETNPAVAAVAESQCQFATPDPGDWVLSVKTRK